MIKNTFINIVIFTLFTVVLSSCTEVIDMEFTTDFERIVVDGTIMDRDTIQYVKLSKINLNDEEDIVLPILNAIVVVNDGENDIVFNDINNNGLYIAPKGFVGEYGKTYILSIAKTGVKGIDGSENYTASALMSKSLTIDSATYEFINLSHMRMVGYNLQCWAWDPPVRNYYLFKAWKNGVHLTDTLYELGQSDDVIFNGVYIGGVNCQFLSDYKDDEYVNSGDTLSLEIDNIDKAYFDYLNSAQKEFMGTNPMFGGPPANVITNVSNGAVGIFRVYSVSKSSVIVKEAIRY